MQETEVVGISTPTAPVEPSERTSTWATMTKRGKKRSEKKNVDGSQEGVGSSSDIPDTDTEHNGLPTQASHRDTSPTMVDLSFYRASAQLYGELHQRLNRVRTDEFTEANVLQTGRQLLQALDQLARAADPRTDPKGSCPFVMLLSMVLPTLRKYLSWTKSTRSIWNSYPAVLRVQSTNSDAPAYKSEIDTALWAMIAQHDILTRISVQAARILRFIDINEGVDHDGPLPKQKMHHAKTVSSTSSESSSASSAASTPREPTDTIVQPPQANRFLIPQVHHISLELSNAHAECKVYLAEFVECLVEKIDLIARYMCTPTASKDAAKTRVSAREFVERLVLQLLEPIGQRMVADPSPAYTSLFPRVLEQCITVTIEYAAQQQVNFARSNGKRNDLQAGPFEAAAMHLRTWSCKLEIEYNTLVRYIGNNNKSNSNHEGSWDADTMDNPASNRLDLLNLGGFKRLDSTVNSWLNSNLASANGPDPGSGTSARSWGVSNIAGGIRSTLVRSFSGRSTFSGSPSS